MIAQISPMKKKAWKDAAEIVGVSGEFTLLEQGPCFANMLTKLFLKSGTKHVNQIYFKQTV